MTQTPPVGTIVQFFPGGRIDHNRQPYAAIITEVGSGGMAKVSLFPPGGGMVLGNHKFHRHIDDPWVKDNLTYLSGSDPGTMPRGCWDFVPAVETEQEDRKEIGFRKVREYAEQGLDAKEIAPKVRQFGISKAEVEDEIGAPA